MSKYRQSAGNSLEAAVKKFFLSAFVVLTFLAYILHERFASATQQANGNNGAASNGAQLVSDNATGNYKDGTYTGSEADAYYGWVKVQAVIQNGKISDVKFLEYPNDRRTSQRINAQVMPWLQQEAIQAQSARVNIISGATLTSEAFVHSLQAALDSARN